MSFPETSFIDRVEGPLEQLGKLFCLTRRELAKSVLDQATALEASLGHTRQSLNDSREQLAEARSELEQTVRLKQQLEQQQAELKDQIESLNTQHKRLQQHFKHALKVIEQQRQDSQQLSHRHSALVTEFSEQEGHWSLIRSILTATPASNNALADFHRLLEADFTTFVNNDNSYERKTESLRVLRAVEKELQLLHSTPALASKSLISLYGRAGAGKSSLINSFIRSDDAPLPINVDPSISLAHYVYQGEDNLVRGYTANGGALDIAPGVFSRLPLHSNDHRDFDIGAIMPFTTVSTHLDDRFRNLCLIKHPGYKAANDHTLQSNDLALAASYLNQANAMLWVLDLAQERPLSKASFTILSELSRPDRPLYVLISKAERYTEEQQQKALDAVCQLLAACDIQWQGVGTYCISTHESPFWRGQSLDDFLAVLNEPRCRSTRLMQDIIEVFNGYRRTVGRMIRRNDYVLEQLRESERAFIAQADDDALLDFQDRIRPVRSMFDNTELVEREHKARTLCLHMITTVQRLIAEVRGLEPEEIGLPELATLDELLAGETVQPLMFQETEGGWEDALAAELDNPEETPYDSGTYASLLDFLRKSVKASEARL